MPGDLGAVLTSGVGESHPTGTAQQAGQILGKTQGPPLPHPAVAGGSHGGCSEPPRLHGLLVWFEKRMFAPRLPPRSSGMSASLGSPWEILDHRWDGQGVGARHMPSWIGHPGEAVPACSRATVLSAKCVEVPRGKKQSR